MLISARHLSQTVPCIRTYTCNRSIRHSTKPNTKNHFGANPISFEIGKSSISANRSFRIGKFSHSLTLSFFGLGLFRETNSAHAVMTSSRLHFTLDKTALMQSLQSDAIRSSCASVPRSGLQSYDAYGDIRAQRKKSTCTHSEESVHSGREGGACIEHSGRQHDSHDHQCHEHQEQHYLTS